jgi:hypothetical protein
MTVAQRDALARPLLFPPAVCHVLHMLAVTRSSSVGSGKCVRRGGGCFRSTLIRAMRATAAWQGRNFPCHVKPKVRTVDQFIRARSRVSVIEELVL